MDYPIPSDTSFKQIGQNVESPTWTTLRSDRSDIGAETKHAGCVIYDLEASDTSSSQSVNESSNEKEH
jgi:hypothetical protein